MTILEELFEKRRAAQERRRSAIRDWIRIGITLAGLAVSLVAAWTSLK